jgi:hypothetical protein
VFITNASSNVVGGDALAAGNVIAFNGGSGVTVNFGNLNVIRLNSIFSNDRVAIDLAGDGAITPNDPLDVDTLSNNRQNFPVLSSSLVLAPGATQVIGSLNSTPNSTFLVDFYSSPTVDPVGGKQARTYAGTITVTTDANGNATFSPILPVTLAAGSVLAATATTTSNAPFGDTSEVGPQVQVFDASNLPKLSVNDVTITEGNSGTKAGRVYGQPQRRHHQDVRRHRRHRRRNRDGGRRLRRDPADADRLRCRPGEQADRRDDQGGPDAGVAEGDVHPQPQQPGGRDDR